VGSSCGVMKKVSGAVRIGAEALQGAAWRRARTFKETKIDRQLVTTLGTHVLRSGTHVRRSAFPSTKLIRQSLAPSLAPSLGPEPCARALGERMPEAKTLSGGVPGALPS
jgi:hypothetical protein